MLGSTPDLSSDIHTDILVMGAGLSGLTLAKALEYSGLSVMLCEQSPDPATHITSTSFIDQRAIALSLESQQALEHLGAWAMMAHESTPIQNVHVSSQGQWGVCRVSAQQEGLESLGVVIPITRLASGLRASLHNTLALKMYFDTRLVSFQQETHAVQALLAQPGKTLKVQAKLLIAADGAHSPVRAQLGIPTSHHNYQQIAWVMQAQIKRPHHQMAYERFTPEGPLAILPRSPDTCVSITWVRKDHHPPFNTLSDPARCALLQEAFGYRLGKFLSTHDPQGYPLVLQQAERLFQDRVLLLGNAAHHLHPVAGQGFNLTLRDVRVLAQLLKATPDLTLKSLQTLFNAYTLTQAEDQRLTVQITHQLTQVFQSKHFPTRCLRACALNLLERSPVALTKLNNQLMGLTAPGIHRYGHTHG